MNYFQDFLTTKYKHINIMKLFLNFAHCSEI